MDLVSPKPDDHVLISWACTSALYPFSFDAYMRLYRRRLVRLSPP